MSLAALAAKAPDIEVIKAFLIKEYGYLHPRLSSISTVTLQTVNLNEISVHEDIFAATSEQDLSCYQNIDFPIILHKTNHRLRLIDGYHRLARDKRDNKTNVLALVLE